MIEFPVFEELKVSGYGLFPGVKHSHGLRVTFHPGLTLILGANGLGKTTLITILYRLLTGPYDIPGLSRGAELGTVRLKATELSASGRAIFANRVVDGAQNASGYLSFRLGKHELEVERRLKDLRLIHLSVDAKKQDISEETFQQTLINLVGVWSFADWILLLRHLIFYFEDRRALVWDASAQRQILRFLFLSSDKAQKWTTDERDILQTDSRMRNLNAALTREEQAVSSTEIKLKGTRAVLPELRALERLQGIDEEKLKKLESELPETDAVRQRARLEFLNAEQAREDGFRELERAKLLAIAARFPTPTTTARYILAQLMTDGQCLVCGNNSPKAAADLARRIKDEKCVVCGSAISASESVVENPKVADARVERLVTHFERLAAHAETAKKKLEDGEAAYDRQVHEIASLNAAISDRSARIDVLVARLPPTEAEIHKQRAEMLSLRGRVATMRESLASKRRSFRQFIAETKGTILKQSNQIKAVFDDYAAGFLLEECQLVWSPQRDRVGETGETVEYPAFELNLTGSNFPSPVRRSAPEEVSESQREFIDLSFRMALMTAANTNGSASLVMDAPESSLDAVFSPRAADVLARFALARPTHRLVITSNLVDGDLIPELLKRATVAGDRSSRLVDLLKEAVPTAAVRQLRDEYEEARERILGLAEKQ